MSTRTEAVKNIRFLPFWWTQDGGSVDPFEAALKQRLILPNQTGIQIGEEALFSLRLGIIRTLGAVNLANISGHLRKTESSTATEYLTVVR